MRIANPRTVLARATLGVLLAFAGPPVGAQQFAPVSTVSAGLVPLGPDVHVARLDAPALTGGERRRRAMIAVVMQRHAPFGDGDFDVSQLGIRADDEARAEILRHAASRVDAEGTRGVVNHLEVSLALELDVAR